MYFIVVSFYKEATSLIFLIELGDLIGLLIILIAFIALLCFIIWITYDHKTGWLWTGSTSDWIIFIILLFVIAVLVIFIAAVIGTMVGLIPIG